MVDFVVPEKVIDKITTAMKEKKNYFVIIADDKEVEAHYNGSNKIIIAALASMMDQDNEVFNLIIGAQLMRYVSKEG